MSNESNHITRLKSLTERLEKVKENKMRMEALLEQVEKRNQEQIEYAKIHILKNPNLPDEEVLPALREELQKAGKENEEKLSNFEKEINNIEARLNEISQYVNI
jgi:hypothetical protein